MHGDDFISLGDDDSSKRLADTLRKTYDLKVRAILGPDHSDDKSVRISNTTVIWIGDGIDFEADQGHVELVIKASGLEKGKSAATLGVKAKDSMVDEILDATGSTFYRSLTMGINYLAQDRPDIQFARKELARGMSAPTAGLWEKLKRWGQYLLGKLRVVLHYGRQHDCTYLDSRVDANFAGCKSTRKSINGGALTMGRNRLKNWDTTQAVTALSSGEAEFYAVVKGASALLGAILLAKDLGLIMKCHIHSDSFDGAFSLRVLIFLKC